ncbi:MAG: P-loop NTPase, partial [Cellulosilyticum sp.]|nr:P-loop NTPase [Cellulosilyticum sp.]
CDKKHQIFGESKIDEVAAEYNLKVLGKLPIDPSIAKACDNGQVEEVELEAINEIAGQVEAFCK